MVKRIGIIGSRSRNAKSDLKLIIETFEKLYKESDIIVSGDALSGGDRFAEELSKYRQITFLKCRAKWDKHGKGAGIIRNSEIVKNCDVLIACWDKKSSGTKDSIEKAKKINIPVILV